MDKNLKRKWVKALRSGKYRQGRNTLRASKHKNVTWCCLGVLCDLMGVSFEGVSFEAHNNRWVIEGTSESGVLTSKLKRKAGLSSKIERKLVDMNDGVPPGHAQRGIERKSFKEIADYIEENL